MDAQFGGLDGLYRNGTLFFESYMDRGGWLQEVMVFNNMAIFNRNTRVEMTWRDSKGDQAGNNTSSEASLTPAPSTAIACVCGVPSTNSVGMERVLRFLRTRLNAILDKPMEGTVKARFSLRMAYTGNMHASADCTFAEFCAIRVAAKRRNVSGKTFGHEDILQCNPIHTNILTFHTFREFCGAIGENNTDNRRRVAWRERIGRKTKRASRIRIIGTLLMNEEKPDLPFYLLPGLSSLSPSLTDYDREVSVLYRKNCVWDGVEEAFVEAMVPRKMTIQSLMHEAGRICVQDPSGGGTSTSPAFVLQWKPLKPEDKSLVFHDISPGTEGMIEAKVPFVIVNDVSLCSEVGSFSQKGNMEWM